MLTDQQYKARDASIWSSFKQRLDVTQLIHQYDIWINDLLDTGNWEGFLISVMFNQLPGGERAVASQMAVEVNALYSRLLTGLFRQPRKEPHENLPRVFISLDNPVLKLTKRSVKDVSINSGLHYGGIILIPIKNRLKEPFDLYVSSRQSNLIGLHGKVNAISAYKLSDRGRFVDYSFKALKIDRARLDDILVFPKADCELNPTAKARHADLLSEKQPSPRLDSPGL